MKTYRALSRYAALGLLAAGLLGVEPAAAADCYAIGQQVAAEQGGQLANVSQTAQGCRIVVVIPAKDGQRGRKIEVVVPAD